MLLYLYKLIKGVEIMKKKIFSLLFVAASVFAVDFSGMSGLAVVDSVKSGDVKSFAEAGFELSKRVSVQNEDAEDACLVYGNMIKKELAGKSVEQKLAFKNEFDMYFYANLQGLSKVERDNFDEKACYRYANQGMGRGCGMMMKSQRPCMSKGMNAPCMMTGKGMNPNCPLNKTNDVNSNQEQTAASQGMGMNPNCPLNKNQDMMNQGRGVGQGLGCGMMMGGQGRGMGQGMGMNPNCPLNKANSLNSDDNQSQTTRGIGQGLGMRLNSDFNSSNNQ